MVQKKKIKCLRCGACARTRHGIPLSLEEAKAVAGKVPLLVGQGRAKIQAEKGICVAFESKGGRGGCKIYPVRPELCRQYPMLYFNGRAILQRDCSALKGLLAEGTTSLSRKEIEEIPFLAKSLKVLEKAVPNIKRQQNFEITNA